MSSRKRARVSSSTTRMDNDDDDNDSTPRFGKMWGAVLPTVCDLTEIQLEARMRRGDPIESPEEYLARNALQNRRIPLRRHVTPSTSVPTKIITLPTHIPTSRVPSSTRSIVVHNFMQLRSVFSQWQTRLEHDSTLIHRFPVVQFPTEAPGRIAWLEFCFGRSSDDTETDHTGNPPLAHILLRMQQVEIVRVIRAVFSQIESTHTINEQQSAWLFATLACLELPTTRDVHSTLRRVLRSIQSIQPSNNYGEMICIILESAFDQGDDL